MKDEELKIEEIETSHTLGGYRRCRCYSAVRYTIMNRSHRICCRLTKVWLRKKHVVYYTEVLSVDGWVNG